MIRKLTMLGVVLGAVAILAAPAAAGAGTVAQEGSILPTGTVLTGVSTNSEFTSELGTFLCSNATLAGTLNENDGTFRIAGEETGSSITGCSIEGNPITVTNVGLTTVESTSSEVQSGHLGLAFVVHWFGVECHFESQGASGVFHYDAVNRGTKITVERTGLFGPCGAMTFHGTFLITAGGKEVELW